MTLDDVLNDLTRRGYTAHFAVSGDALRAIGRGKTFKPDELIIREYHRFEGISDPDDMSIVYAIEGRDGTRGTLVDAFGVYANPGVGTLLQNVPIQRAA
jgi:hypothetical protein